MQQMTLGRTKHDPHATERMDIAIADFISSNRLPISLLECAKFNKLIQSTRHIPPKYIPLYRKKMAGLLLEDNYQSTYDEQMRSLLKEFKVFGIELFGNGTTILKVPMMIFLGSSPNNPFALLDIVDCTSDMAKGGQKDAKYIAGLLKPIILQIEQTKDPNNQKTNHQGVVDLVLFDGASNVQNAGKLVSITSPCITVVHGAEHVISLFFKDIFTKMPVFQFLTQFLKWCRNIFGSTHCGPHAIFKKHFIIHNNCIYIGFIKISECCMAGELIELLHLLRLRDILRGTIASKEFKDVWEKRFRERSLFLKTMSSVSIYLHCVVLSMHQCVSFD
jgi:hypothetical protein